MLFVTNHVLDRCSRHLGQMQSAIHSAIARHETFHGITNIISWNQQLLPITLLSPADCLAGCMPGAAAAASLLCVVRYGDEQHLDEALDRIWRFGRAGNPPKKMCPKLVGLREEVVDVSTTHPLPISQFAVI